jgi:hypothetical protein
MDNTGGVNNINVFFLPLLVIGPVFIANNATYGVFVHKKVFKGVCI